MNLKAILPLVIGVGIAGVAGKLGIDYVRKASAGPKSVQLWTTTVDIPRGSAIDEASLAPLNFPVTFAPKNAITDKTKLVGRVASNGVPAGVPVLDSMLLPTGARPGIQVPDGYRAVAVKIDESSGVDNHLQPGDWVDVVGFFNTRRNNKSEIMARTLLENVQVAAVGAKLAPEAPAGKPDPNAKKQTTSSNKPARAVTLLVKPDQVPTLHLAEQRGKLKLSMRSNIDPNNTSASTGVTSEDDVLGIEPEPEVAEGGPSPMNDLLGGLIAAFQSKPSEPDAEPEPQPEPEPDPVPAEPSYEWKMVVFNGNERQVVGWLPGALNEPHELSTEGPNIFDPDRPQPPILPTERKKAPPARSQSKPQKSDASKSKAPKSDQPNKDVPAQPQEPLEDELNEDGPIEPEIFGDPEPETQERLG